MKETSQLRSHRSISSGTVGGIYPHIVVRYENEITSDQKETWYVDLDTNNNPYRVSKDIRKYKSINFDALFPLKSSTELQIKELIEFENRFELLKKSNCSKLLEHKFVFAKEVGEWFNAIFRTEQNGIMFGPGGHGKSEMAAEIVETAELYKNTFIKSFGEGLTESALYGGTNMRILRESGDVEFNLWKAFTAYEIIIFEELFDAPPSVLLALKDTLTSGYVRNGTQREPIRCRCVIGLTNKAPAEIASNDSRQALTERFPLRINVKWNSYNADDYEQLIRKKFHDKLTRPLEMDGIGLTEQKADFYITSFCEITEKASKNGRPLSPRIVSHGFNQIMASITQNSFEDSFAHFSILKFVDGYEKLSDDIVKRVENIEQVIQSKHEIAAVKSDYDKLYEKIKTRVKTDAQSLANYIKSIDSFVEKHKGKRFHDTHVAMYENIMRNVIIWRETMEKEITEGALNKLGLKKSLNTGFESDTNI